MLETQYSGTDLLRIPQKRPRFSDAAHKSRMRLILSAALQCSALNRESPARFPPAPHKPQSAPGQVPSGTPGSGHKGAPRRPTRRISHRRLAPIRKSSRLPMSSPWCRCPPPRPPCSGTCNPPWTHAAPPLSSSARPRRQCISTSPLPQRCECRQSLSNRRLRWRRETACHSLTVFDCIRRLRIAPGTRRQSEAFSSLSSYPFPRALLRFSRIWLVRERLSPTLVT